MIEQLEKYKNKQNIVIIPHFDLDLKDSLEYTLNNVIEIDRVEEDNKIIELINNSKIKKIYLVGNNDFYRFILPRLKKEITRLSIKQQQQQQHTHTHTHTQVIKHLASSQE